ncbi:aldehyde dehydrogenase family protein [Imbroritus primus]|uniref:Aldehyde dehydrogenase family protein n=1 Tax=Imbroritus primus TaxID=3058603 RepID=A0ACD3SR71_9BURK|nr:aldehyde dehydrogenase family protein [Burkholderiaceae bacterium PBA]
MHHDGVYANYIAAEWCRGNGVTENRNPSDTDDVVGRYAQASTDDVERAIGAAEAAFPTWSTGGIQARSEALEQIGAEILSRKDELAHLLAREEGKTLAEAHGEVLRAAHIFKFFAGECVRQSGELLPSVRSGVSVEITREPLGVIGIITPWNFPLAIPAWKIAPALAYGNCVVFKPADLVPASAWALAEIISRAGLPTGVFNLVMGRGSVVGDALVNHPAVAAITFTGSVPVGQRIGAACAAAGKKVQLEMGGKNPQVVLDDANLEQAVELCAQSAFYQAGQRCTASSRIIVTGGIYGAFVDALAARLQRIQVGHALAADTDIGPVASAGQLEQNLEYVAIGQAEGATLRCGGERLERGTPGYYMRPALFIDTDNRMRINREEIFGPIATVQRARNYEEALALANDTAFGLSSGIATTSLKYAQHFKRHSQAGMVMVNLPTAGVDYHVPFGGRKGSSYGPREQGRYAQEFFTTVKTAYLAA